MTDTITITTVEELKRAMKERQDTICLEGELAKVIHGVYPIKEKLPVIERMGLPLPACQEWISL